MATTVIAGGAGHLGQALARRALSRGDDVHLVDINPRVGDIANDLGAVGHLADATDTGQLQALGQLAAVDSLICAVGSWPRISWPDLHQDLWNQLISTNLSSAYAMTHLLTPALVRQSGSVVFVGSAIALKGNPQMAHYAASKAGLHGLAKSLALALGPHRVRVNVVAPGLIETPDADHTWTLKQRQELWKLRAIEDPLSIDEVVEPIAFLASEQATGITGQVLVVDKGVVLH